VTSARDIPDAIQWHEGMLLAPQHFQQMAARFDLLQSYHIGAAAPFHWGIVQFQFDRVALISGIFRVLELEAVMPDGLVVHHSASAAAELELDVTSYADPIAPPRLTIHLCVPAARSSGDTARGEMPRYASAEGPVVTDESGESELRIPRLQPRLSLMVTSVPGQKPPQKFISFPLAQVTYQNEAFALGDFVPPSLAVTQQSSLARVCVEIARRAREKALFLAERAASPATADNQHLVHEIQAEIRCLVAGLPRLEALIGARVIHPFVVYLTLCDLVGQFSIFSTGGVPPTLSHYDHNNCLAAYSEVRDFALRMLDRVKENATPIAFTLENGKFGLVMEEEWLKRKLIVGVKGSPNMNEQEVIAWMEQSLIAASTKIDKLWQMRIKGAGRRQIDATSELDITPGRGVMLFMIDNDSQFIQPGETLEIWNAETASARGRVAEIVLYA